METFKLALPLMISIFLACSCSNVFYVDFDKDVVVNFSNNSPLAAEKQKLSWSTIPYPADGFNIITKATFIAEGVKKNPAHQAHPPILALQN